MTNLTIAQKIYLAALLAAVGACLGLAIGAPIYEYNYGKSAFTALLEHLATVSLLAVLGIVVIGWILQGIGILPMPRRNPQPASSSGKGVPSAGGLRSLGLWIVIALALVAVFNLFQVSDGEHPKISAPGPARIPAQPPDLPLLSLFISWFPMLLIFGVGIFFLRRMQGRKDTNKPNNS